MIYTDILKQANVLRGAKIDAALGKWYINEGMQRLATTHDTARKRETGTLVVPANTWTDLPAGCLTVVECAVGGMPYDAIEVSFGQIRTSSSQDLTLELVYLTAYPDVVSDSDVPGVHELYHKPLALFMAARDRKRLMADEENYGDQLMAEFAMMASQVDEVLRNAKRTRRIMAVGVLR